MIHALYVDPANGPYATLLGAERCWGVERDAKRYDGPGSVIAHPPCKTWGRFAYRVKAADHKAAHPCGPRAVEQVRSFGGVLEHPQGSKLWKECGLPRPGEPADTHGGYTVEVRQVDWGHPTPKPTWLYIVGCPKAYVDRVCAERAGTGTPTHCIVRKRCNPHSLRELPKRLRHVTPPEFADFLLDIAIIAEHEVRAHELL